jgi:aldose 1-epimerase
VSRAEAAVHVLTNRRGDRVELSAFGARIRALTLALPSGPRNVVVGYASLAQYRTDRYFMGGTIGRYCNRIGGARFTIAGREYRLVANEGRNLLHGGADGFHLRDWQRLPGADACMAAFRLVSPDGDQGFPGALTVDVRYTWNDARELVVEHAATTDRPTHVSLTNHAYWNLDGAAKGTADTADRARAADAAGAAGAAGAALDQSLRVAAGRYTPTDDEQIPTGNFADVARSPLDLRTPCVLRERVREPHAAIAKAEGFDCNYVLDARASAATECARLTSASGDLAMTLATSLPGLQVYTGQHLRAPFAPCAGVCLEPQYFPDAPNRPEFPSTLLEPGNRYEHFTRYRFAT